MQRNLYGSDQRLLRQTAKMLRKQTKSRECPAGTTSKVLSKADLKVGTIVKDRVPPDAIQLIEVPIKHNAAFMNVSDNTFETMGNDISDTLDFQHKVLHHGIDAAELMRTIQHPNNTCKGWLRQLLLYRCGIVWINVRLCTSVLYFLYASKNWMNVWFAERLHFFI